MNPLLALFHEDLKRYLPLLENPHTIEEAARAIAGGARLVGFDAVATLAKGLEEAARQELTENALQNIKRAVALLKELQQTDPAQLAKVAEEKKEAFLAASEAFSKKAGAAAAAAEVHFDSSMMELFRAEVETQVQILTDGLVELERGQASSELFEALMRAAHSTKGAARVVGLTPIVQLAHAMEDCFVAAQKQALILQPSHIDTLLEAIDLIAQISHLSDEELQTWIVEKREEIARRAGEVASLTGGEKAAPEEKVKKEPPKQVVKPAATSDRILRVSAQNLNRLMGLAGESLVETRWLQPFGTSLLAVKKQIHELSHLVDLLREKLEPQGAQFEEIEHYLSEIAHKINLCGQSLTDRLAELDLFIIRQSNLSDRLYREVIDSRMRPFADGIQAFPRLVRDMARDLGKKVRLEVIGQATPVDRDILEKLEAPLSHLLRNAVDHGIEKPEERVSLGKPVEGVITLEAQHRAGMLAISVSDDGRGIDPEAIRKKIVERNLAKAPMAEKMTQQELLEFLFLPGFSTAQAVTEISGRGVGLNVVQSMVQEVSGTVRIETEPNKGLTFYLQLPLTLSVIRALIVSISGEPYAFPLARIDRALHVAKEQIEQVESRQYYKFEGQNVGLVPAAQVLELEERQLSESTLPIILFSDRMNSYGIVVDQLLGERELVVQELDARLGKVADISSGALMEDGSPILIVDVEDMVRSIDAILKGGRLHKLRYGEKADRVRRKRILVVDDSITVREVECRLLQNQGYEVQTAINGMDGWNALRMGEFDLLLTDVDMPRMNGIELIRLVRSDPRLKNLPVLIVSYKEREEDRRQGLEAGANYYLTKSSFQDESLLQAVAELIGGAT